MNKTALTIASIVAAFGISAGAATSASAKPAELCVGKKIYAHASNTTVTGTCGNDTIIVGKYNNVTVNALGGNDEIKSGWGAFVTIHGGDGNDTVYNGGYQQAIVYGDAGNDHMEGSMYADQFHGGSGTDAACVGANDTTDSIESTFLC